ncbi:MAG: mannose-1-phosphate guanylyltransferase/mannose-6-phosphate isomerase, partial [Chloroflexi bacterium]|nr:mannose-1-phosphate guanylyltransferase/mannose-6-phosphate isomerase [Chloroflexota bacterium]
PLSSRSLPKQFLSFVSDRTLFQEALGRLDGMAGIRDTIVVGNEAQGDLIMEQSSQVGRMPSLVILEPVGRDTAPALTLAVLALKENVKDTGLDPVILVMPSDHLIGKVQAFQSAVYAGVRLAEEGYLVTFGIAPTRPATEYGYLKKGKSIKLQDYGDLWRVAFFREKPEHDLALSYVQSRSYLWNSGIFIMQASIWLKELTRYRPDIVEACRAASAKGKTDGRFLRPDPELFRACPRDSIDYAVMEKAAANADTADEGLGGSPCAVVLLEAGWTDLGDWAAVWEAGSPDNSGNVIKGDVSLDSVKDSLVLARHRVVGVIGLDNVVVVETHDAVLVVHKDRVQDVKGMVEKLEAPKPTSREA